VFSEPKSGWQNGTQAAELIASNPTGTGDHRGQSVATDGTTIAAGAPDHWVDGDGKPDGAAYVFTEPGAGWDRSTTEGTVTPVRITCRRRPFPYFLWCLTVLMWIVRDTFSRWPSTLVETRSFAFR
jgi:hypothetical protein